MQKIVSLLIALFPVALTFAQSNKYAVSQIPDSLLKGSRVVVREVKSRLTIKDRNTARYEERRVFTILNEQAKDELSFSFHSSKFRILDNMEIKTYDAAGVKKETWTKKDMNSGKYGNDLVPEGLYTFFNIPATSFPITVEFNYDVKYRGTFNLPGYYIQWPHESVQYSLFEIETPSELGVRYKLNNTDQQPAIRKEGSKDVYSWEARNLKAYHIEQHIGSYDQFVPMVHIAPNKFQLDEYAGDMTSWTNFGKWMNTLYADVSGLTEDKKQFYRNLVKHARSDQEKAAILYRYLQDNMRYVSIQLGIGGWKPFAASFVEEKKYGDCKALSNYMRATLEAVGIRSNIVIIYRDYEVRQVDDRFPMNNFNHAILCIPGTNDTTWLECTSTVLPFGRLDETTLSRKAVMITEHGGVLVNTPPSNYTVNTENSHTRIEVLETGGASVDMRFTLSGEMRSSMLEQRFHDLKDEEKRRLIISSKSLKQPDEFELSDSKSKADPYILHARLGYEKVYSFNAGSKLFFESRLYAVFNEQIPEQENRQRDYYFDFPYEVKDTTIYKFPPGYQVESMPKNRLVQHPFVAFTCNYNWDASANTLSCITVLQIKNRVVKAADYPKLLEFKKQVMANVNEKIVMKKP